MMFPFEIKPLDEEENRKLLSLFKGEKSGFCQVGSDKWFLPISYREHAEVFYNMELREDDVFIVTFPRTGTTFTQELIWMVNNDMDFERSASVALFERFPFIDLDVLVHDELGKEMKSLNQANPSVLKTVNDWKTPAKEVLEKTPSPRHLKTHLPFSLLPPNILEKCKVIYLARNAKDVAVSYYFHNKLIRLHDFTGNFETYWELFKNDQVIYAPYWRHTEEGWERRDHPNLLFLFYEDIVKDTKGAIRRVSEFLNKPMSEEDIQKLFNHLQIENFSKNVPLFTSGGTMHGWTNTSDEGFIRKGDSRGKKEVTEEILGEIKEWVNEHVKINKIAFP